MALHPRPTMPCLRREEPDSARRMDHRPAGSVALPNMQDQVGFRTSEATMNLRFCTVSHEKWLSVMDVQTQRASKRDYRVVECTDWCRRAHGKLKPTFFIEVLVAGRWREVHKDVVLERVGTRLLFDSACDAGEMIQEIQAGKIKFIKPDAVFRGWTDG